MTCLKMINSILLRRFHPTFVLSVGLLFTCANAHAECGLLARAGASMSSKLPFVLAANLQPQQEGANNSIVGMWHVTYTVDGTLFYEAYDQWHSDHTEFENANVSPIGGNVCMGVWKKIGSRTVRLNHVGWSFDGSGNSNGTFTINEKNTVSLDGNSYQGTFTYRFFNPDGTLAEEINGTLNATRITAD